MQKAANHVTIFSLVLFPPGEANRHVSVTLIKREVTADLAKKLFEPDGRIVKLKYYKSLHIMNVQY